MKYAYFGALALTIGLCLHLPALSQSGSQIQRHKTGSLAERRVLRGQSLQVSVSDFRGSLQWQQSDDGTHWFDWAGKTQQTITPQVNTVLFLRCAITESNCDPVYSDPLKISPYELPVVTTDPVSAIAANTAQCGGSITGTDISPISTRGVCWSTSPDPTIINNKTDNGPGSGAFTSNITGLTGNTPYYVRAFATNADGTFYGNQVSFNTTLVLALPTVTTDVPGSITQVSASSGGNVTADGGAPVTERGVCWNTTGTPTTANDKTTDGSGTGTFKSSLNGLTASTPYFVRAYATNSIGTAYGEEKQFTTATGGGGETTLTDSRDGHTYKTVTIGSQTWTAENIAYLPSVNGYWVNSETIPYYYVYGYMGTSVDDAKATTNFVTHGVLYNWTAAVAACPSGWHLPTDGEWTTLVNFLGSGAGGKLKEAGFNHWLSPNTGATNESGFTALGSGGMSFWSGYLDMGGSVGFWTSSVNSGADSWYYYLLSTSDQTGRLAYNGRAGFSVRCVKD